MAKNNKMKALGITIAIIIFVTIYFAPVLWADIFKDHWSKYILVFIYSWIIGMIVFNKFITWFKSHLK